MPDVIATGLDYSARRLTGQQIRAAGYKFVNRYLWFPGQQWPALTAEETADLLANGIEVHAIYEQNTNDPAGGYEAGARMAVQAVASAKAAGLPKGHTIYMCSDAWLTTHGIPVATAMRFLDGARPVIEADGYVLGAYGFQDFVYAAQDGGHADRFWLCGAESGVRDGIHHYQWNNGRVHVDGLQCDLNKQYLPMKESDDMPSLDELKKMPIKLHPDEGDVDQRPEAPFEEVVSYGNKASWLAADRAAANGLKLDALLGRDPVDEAELARQLLAQGLNAQLGRLPADQVEAIAVAASNEIDRRARIRANADLRPIDNGETGQ